MEIDYNFQELCEGYKSESTLYNSAVKATCSVGKAGYAYTRTAVYRKLLLSLFCNQKSTKLNFLSVRDAQQNFDMFIVV